jgi:DNA-binding FadR family transcriptional regulator
MLREAVSRLDESHRSLSEHIDADLAFHLLLCELSGNSVLVNTWKHLEGRVRITILSDGDENHHQIMSTSHHAPIVDAIEAGDAFQALGVIQQHMMIAADRLASSAD